MLGLSFGLLCAAAVIGAGLLYIGGPGAKSPPAALLVAHAVLGATSLVALLLALHRGLPPTGLGTASFGRMAGGLLTLALAFGLLLARASWRRRRPSEMLVGTHAGLAIAGFVLLLTLVALR